MFGNNNKGKTKLEGGSTNNLDTSEKKNQFPNSKNEPEGRDKTAKQLAGAIRDENPLIASKAIYDAIVEVYGEDAATVLCNTIEQFKEGDKVSKRLLIEEQNDLSADLKADIEVEETKKTNAEMQVELDFSDDYAKLEEERHKLDAKVKIAKKEATEEHRRAIAELEGKIEAANKLIIQYEEEIVKGGSGLSCCGNSCGCN